MKVKGSTSLNFFKILIFSSPFIENPSLYHLLSMTFIIYQSLHYINTISFGLFHSIINITQYLSFYYDTLKYYRPILRCYSPISIINREIYHIFLHSHNFLNSSHLLFILVNIKIISFQPHRVGVNSLIIQMRNWVSKRINSSGLHIPSMEEA